MNVTKLDQNRAPIYEALERFRQARVVPFDVPGHKHGRGNPELAAFLGQQCVGVDVNSVPMADLTDKGAFWGFDIQLAMAATDLLGWNLKLQPIEKEDVYIELSSGNIDVAWGGIALNEKELKEGLYSQLGPYVHNDIVIAARSGSFIYNTLMLSGKRLVMNSTTEAMDALNVDPRLARRLGQITRMAKGTAECFQALGEGKCDVVLADSTAVCHFNHR